MVSAPVEQEEIALKFGPFAPISMETLPEAMSPSIMGMRNGLTLEGPRSIITWNSCERVCIPPMPLPIITDTRSASSAARSSPADATASCAATAANCTKRSILRASLRSR